MTSNDHAENAIYADLSAPHFRAGLLRHQWRQVLFTYPILIVGVAAIEKNGESSEYFFRFELTGYPVVAPEVMIWDCATNKLLPTKQRPTGSPRVNEAFKSWGPPDTIYRPWERTSGTHNDWGKKHPELAWHPKRDLTFILEDLHGLLNSNPRACGNRPAAEIGLQ